MRWLSMRIQVAREEFLWLWPRICHLISASEYSSQSGLALQLLRFRLLDRHRSFQNGVVRADLERSILSPFWKFPGRRRLVLPLLIRQFILLSAIVYDTVLAGSCPCVLLLKFVVPD